ncbi:hypothetical protein HanIR_Chr06g0269411 [Helianthus annuus]|nr:hypothetical protein HanIR_Chr06g0269411 [Helianthus annuus]
MSLLEIVKDQEEWVDKLADALPQKEWGTYLMILKNTGEYDKLTISQFIEKIEGQDLEQQKIARMNSPSGQQDIKMYYKGSVQDVEATPKVQTAFSAKNSSGSVNQSPNSTIGFSSYPGVNPKVSTSSHQFQSSNNSNGRIGNPMLTKEDYDQIDAEEMELMDIKWCLASVKKGHFKRECKNQEVSGAKNPFVGNNYYQKAIYQQVSHQPYQQKEPQTAHAKMIEEANKKAYFGIVDQDDEKVAECFSWDKYIPPDSKVVALTAQIIQESDLMKEWMKGIAGDEKNQDGDFVSSDDSSENTQVFDQSLSDDSDDEEEVQINIGKSSLSPESF